MEFRIEVVVGCSGFFKTSTCSVCAWLYTGSILENELCLAKYELDNLGLDVVDDFECRLKFSPANNLQAPGTDEQCEHGLQTHKAEGVPLYFVPESRNAETDSRLPSRNEDEGLMVKIVSKNSQLYWAKLAVHENNQVSLRFLHPSGPGDSCATAGWWQFFALSSSLSSSKRSAVEDMDKMFYTASSSSSGGESSSFLWSSTVSSEAARDTIIFHVAQVKKIERTKGRSVGHSEDKIAIEFRNGKKLHLMSSDAFSVMAELNRAVHDVDQTQSMRMVVLHNILTRTFAHSPHIRLSDTAQAITSSLRLIWSTVFPSKEIPALDAKEWLGFGCMLRVADPHRDLKLLPSSEDVYRKTVNIYVEPVALELLAYYSTHYGYAVRHIVLQTDICWLDYKLLDMSVLITRMLFLRLGVRDLCKGTRLNDWAQHPSDLLLCLSSLKEETRPWDDCQSQRHVVHGFQASVSLCEVTCHANTDAL